MKLHPIQFLGNDVALPDPDKAAVAVLPFPYEGGVSYGKGTGKAPRAVLEASPYLEFYDEVLKTEPYRVGIITLAEPEIPSQPERMIRTVYQHTRELLEQNKFVILLGGDHSISSGYARALKEKYGQLSVIQIDAHSDLRDEYEGSKLSHACVMARIRELTPHTLQIGIRSMSAEEARLVENQGLNLVTMHDYRAGRFDLNALLYALPDPVFITFDVDAFDWSVVWSTGTPEPGGLLWDEAMSLLQEIFARKNVVGADVVELSHADFDRNSPFAVAKLIYKMIGFKFYLSR